MGAATGGHHTVVGASTIPTLPRTVALTGAMVIILTRRLTMIITRELMAGNKQPMVLTDRQQEVPATIPTLALMPEALQSRPLTVLGVQRRRTIRTPEPMLRPDKVRVRTLSGVAPMYHEEIRALLWGTTRLPMEQWQAPLIRREEKWPLPARSGGTAQ